MSLRLVGGGGLISLAVVVIGSWGGGGLRHRWGHTCYTGGLWRALDIYIELISDSFVKRNVVAGDGGGGK